MGYPTAAAGSFLLLAAGHRSLPPSRSDPGPLSMINKASSGVLSLTLPNFAKSGSVMEAMTMTAWICQRRLGPTKRPLYPQVIAYATSRPRFVASWDDLLSKGN